jgi:HTH-type transcriptional regulator / antitoxin HigA
MNGKMTRTFNTKSYTDLLVQYQPKPIETEAENDRAIALAQELEHRPTKTPEEEIFLELLITLIEKFEAENYLIPTGTTSSIVHHLMDAKGLNETDLISVLGTEAAVSEILTHQRPIQLDAAKKLAQFFHVELDLFLGLD